MKIEIDTRFFRAGVGTVIYKETGEVAIFERAQNPIGVWQFQQGGIDLGEDFETTLWRELAEEIGLTKNDFVNYREYPGWTYYQDPAALADKNKSRLGQMHRWYFLQLRSDVEIDLSKATEYEASDFKWVSFAQAVDMTDSLLKNAYQQLETFFTESIVNRD
jgi:putative (di)nucleoside polyphosphate hydrolase